MNNIFYLSSLVLLFMCLEGMAQGDSTKITIRITDESGKVLEKEYNSEEALENDPELKEMGVEVEAGEGRVRLKSEGNQNQVVIIQRGGNGNKLYMQQGPGLGPDSSEILMHPPLHSLEGDSISEQEFIEQWLGRNPEVRKELVEEDIRRMMAMRDSLLSQRLEQRAERMEEMQKRQEEMRQRMEERREHIRKEKELIIIEDPTKKEKATLGIKKDNLELEALRIFPDTEQETLRVAFQSRSNDPVTIKLSDSRNRLLLEETFPLSEKSFEKELELEDFGEGIYFLQIIQNKKSLVRKISIQ